MIEEIELPNIRGHDERQGCTQDREANSPCHRRREADRDALRVSTPPFALARVQRETERCKVAVHGFEGPARSVGRHDV